MGREPAHLQFVMPKPEQQSSRHHMFEMNILIIVDLIRHARQMASPDLKGRAEESGVSPESVDPSSDRDLSDLQRLHEAWSIVNPNSPGAFVECRLRRHCCMFEVVIQGPRFYSPFASLDIIRLRRIGHQFCTGSSREDLLRIGPRRLDNHELPAHIVSYLAPLGSGQTILSRPGGWIAQGNCKIWVRRHGCRENDKHEPLLHLAMICHKRKSSQSITFHVVCARRVPRLAYCTTVGTQSHCGDRVGVPGRSPAPIVSCPRIRTASSVVADSGVRVWAFRLTEVSASFTSTRAVLG